MEEQFSFELKKNLQNRMITIKCKAAIIKNADILEHYYQREVLEQACKEGCPNYGNKWSCPPFSHPYKNIMGKYRKAVLICMSADMEQYLDIKNKYLAVKAANVTLKNSVEKMARRIETEVNGYALLSGSCRLCKPCACKKHQKCRHPDKMRYSIEAVYLNVQNMCRDLLDFELLWYSNKTLPLYTSTVSLVLYNEETGEKLIREILSDNNMLNISGFTADITIQR